MKQRVPSLSSVFRRRSNNKAADKASAAAVRGELPDSDTNRDYPSISQISIVPSKVVDFAKGDHGAIATNDKASAAAVRGELPDSDTNRDYPSISQISIVPSAKVVDFAKGDHGAIATNERPDAKIKTPERLSQYNHCNSSVSSTYSDELEAMGICHLSTREQMWYKNQMYLLAKQKDKAQARRRSPSRASSMYESSNRSIDHYTAGIIKHSDSPKGVNDFDEFESENMYRNVKHCDSRKEVRFHGKNYRISSQVSQNDDDTQTNQSGSLFDEDDNQSSSLFDDDTRTDQSSSLICHEDTHTDASEMNFDEVTLGSITLGSTTLEDTTIEGESRLTSPDDATSMSYVFELLDDENKQRRKYQLGMGHNPISSKSRRGLRKTATPSSNKGASTGQRVTRGRRGENSVDDADFTDAACPLLPRILEEAEGTYNDAKSALEQVLYAFFVSEDDIDRMADKIRDGSMEVIEMYHEQKANKSSRSSLHSD